MASVNRKLIEDKSCARNVGNGSCVRVRHFALTNHEQPISRDRSDITANVTICCQRRRSTMTTSTDGVDSSTPNFTPLPLRRTAQNRRKDSTGQNAQCMCGDLGNWQVTRGMDVLHVHLTSQER